jgi:hypothetical protein
MIEAVSVAFEGPHGLLAGRIHRDTAARACQPAMTGGRLVAGAATQHLLGSIDVELRGNTAVAECHVLRLALEGRRLVDGLGPLSVRTCEHSRRLEDPAPRARYISRKRHALG